jgi:regulator of protease activity HflC (stomatin/prohibitin superfamily)
VLTEALGPHGVLVSQVILHEHRFSPEYEKVIHDRKLAEQKAQQLKSESEAMVQEALRNLETARGKVADDIAQATGALAQAKLAADAEYFQQQQNADAIVTERAAIAKGIQKRNEALKGSGGRAMVKLRIAEALDGKQIILVPGGQSGVGIQKLDINKLVDQAVVNEAAPAAEGAK